MLSPMCPLLRSFTLYVCQLSIILQAAVVHAKRNNVNRSDGYHSDSAKYPEMVCECYMYLEGACDRNT